MSRPLWPAIRWSVALGLGLELGRRAAFCPPALALALAALALALRRPRAAVLGGLGVGLALGAARADRPMLPDPDRPVTLTARIIAPWRRDAQGLSVEVRGLWLRQGARVGRWPRRALLALPDHEKPPTVSRVRVRGHLRRPPPAANGPRSPPGVWVLRAKSWRFVSPLPAAPTLRLWSRLSGRLRAAVERRLTAAGAWAESPGMRLTRALVLGDRWALPEAWVRGLRSTGLAHLTALSGLHVGLLAAAGLTMGSLGPRGARHLLPAALLAVYLLLAGPRPSLLRATAMLLAVATAWWLGRAPQPANTLAWVAAAMTLAEPPLLDDVGFQLTVAATAGLLVLGPRLEARWRWLPRGLRRPLSASVGAQLGALPWTLSTFHLATPLAPVWNLVAMPWTALTLLTSMLWLGVALVLPGAARRLLPILDLVARPFGLVAEIGPNLSCPLPSHLGWGSSLALTGLLLWVLLGRRSVARRAALALAWALLSDSDGQRDIPELTVVDVGQGESILLRDGDAAALVDGGGWSRSGIAQRVLVPVLSRLGVRRLEAIVLTHPDRDHCHGLLELTWYLPVERLVTAPGWQRQRCARELLARPGLPVRALWRGEALDLGRWRLTALHPGAGDRRGRNDRSLVLLAEVEGHRVALTGDLERSGEREVLTASGRLLERLDILKVAHHGSDSSTSVAWLERTRPRLALISCGLRNRYGHPASVVLDRLRRRGTAVLRTDLHGAVRVLLPPGGPPRLLLPGAPRCGP